MLVSWARSPEIFNSFLDSFVIERGRREFNIFLVLGDGFNSSTRFFIQHPETSMGRRYGILQSQRPQIELLRLMQMDARVFLTGRCLEQLPFFFLNGPFLPLLRGLFFGAVGQILVGKLAGAGPEVAIT